MCRTPAFLKTSQPLSSPGRLYLIKSPLFYPYKKEYSNYPWKKNPPTKKLNNDNDPYFVLTRKDLVKNPPKYTRFKIRIPFLPL